MNFIQKTIAIISLTLPTALSAEVAFYDGDNNGALSVAQNFYKISDEKFETAILDIDDNGSAEIGVRFADRCLDDGKCPITILYFYNDEWLEVYSEITQSISLEKIENVEIKRVVSSNDLMWTWFKDRFVGFPNNAKDIWDLSDRLSVEDGLKFIPEVGTSTMSYQYNVDLNSDGTLEKVVSVQDLLSCTGFGICKAYIYDDLNNYIGQLPTFDGRLLIREVADGTQIISPSLDGFLVFAYNDQNIFMTNKIGTMPVRRR